MVDIDSSSNEKSCCTPASGRDGNVAERVTTITKRSPNAGQTQNMIQVQGGPFLMGGEGPECWASDGEGPIREITLSPFYLDRCCVSNEEFEQFVNATGYQTEAEHFGWSFVFFNQIPKARRKAMQFETVYGLSWWAKVEGADWRKPGGSSTNIRKKNGPPCRPYFLERRPCLCTVDGQTPSHRSRMGSRCSGWARAEALSMGR